MARKHALFIAVLCAAGVGIAIAAVGSQPPQQGTTVRLDLTEDAVSFFKFATWVGGGFLLIYAVIGLAFFGFDVRKAKSAIGDDVKDMKGLLSEANTLLASIRLGELETSKLKIQFEIFEKQYESRLAELGAMMEEQQDSTSVLLPARATGGGIRFGVRTTPLPKESDIKAESQAKPSELLAESGGPGSVVTPNKLGDAQAFDHDSSRSRSDLVREVVRNSKFEWTTIGRLVKKSGLDRDEILEIARTMSDVEIGFGKMTKDHLFRLKPVRES